MFTKYTESHLTHEFSHKALESSRELLVVLGSTSQLATSSRGNLLCREEEEEGKGDLCVISPLRLCNGMMSAAGLLESFAAAAAWKILSNVVCEPPGLGIDTILRRSQPTQAARACSRTSMPLYHQVRHSDIFPDIHQSICAS